MKLLFSLFCLLACMKGKAIVRDTILPGPNQKLWVELANGKTKSGFVRYSTDSTILLSTLKYGNGKIIPVENIESISYKDGIGFFPRVFIGSLAGFILGFLTGLNSCDDEEEDCGFFRRVFGRETTKGAFHQGLVFGGIGGIIGGVTGRITYKISINRNRDQFKMYRYRNY